MVSLVRGVSRLSLSLITQAVVIESVISLFEFSFFTSKKDKRL